MRSVRNSAHFLIRTPGLDSELLVYEAVFLGQTVDAIIRLAHPSDGTADGVGLVPAGHPSSRLVYLSQIDLKNDKK
jgi:hypothetical protein